MVIPKVLQINLRQKVKHLLWELNPNDLSWLQRISLRQEQTAELVKLVSELQQQKAK